MLGVMTQFDAAAFANKKVLIVGAGTARACRIKRELAGHVPPQQLWLCERDENRFETARAVPQQGLFVADFRNFDTVQAILGELAPEVVFLCLDPLEEATVCLNLRALFIQGMAAYLQQVVILPASKEAATALSSVCSWLEPSLVQVLDPSTFAGVPTEEYHASPYILNQDPDNPFRAILDRQIPLPPEAADFFQGKRVFITGGAGSIATVLISKLMALDVGSITVVDIDEGKLLALASRFPCTSLRIAPYDVTVEADMEWCLKHSFPQLVFHMAAIKLHPFAQENPFLAFAVNTLGTRNMVRLARRFEAERLVFTSSDKATALVPYNVLGQTRKLGELFLQAHAGEGEPVMTATRFAHVLGSAGSLVTERFIRQISAGQPITLTHPDIFSPFLNLDEAVNIILSAMMLGKKGEIVAIANLGKPIKIMDVARYLARKITGKEGYPIEITGLRPGEHLGTLPHGGRYSHKSQFNPLERPLVRREGAVSISSFMPPINPVEIETRIGELEERLTETTEKSSIRSEVEAAVRHYAALAQSA